jgi:hypothetical protein
MTTPIDTDPNGRGKSGRFGPGNRFGKGNGLACRQAQLRAHLMASINPDDLRAIIKAMVGMAKGGDVAAARLVLTYAAGEPSAITAEAEREAAEEAIARETMRAG